MHSRTEINYTYNTVPVPVPVKLKGILIQFLNEERIQRQQDFLWLIFGGRPIPTHQNFLPLLVTVVSPRPKNSDQANSPATLLSRARPRRSTGKHCLVIGDWFYEHF